MLDELGGFRTAGLVPSDRGRGQRPREKRGWLTGPNPVDRGKSGSTIHISTERGGIPLSVGISAANTHDSHALIPLVLAIPPTRSRRGPRRFRPDKLHSDKAYDHPELPRWLRRHSITARIARRDIDTSTTLGQHRWAVERTVSWLAGYRRLTTRYERYGNHFAAFLTLAAALTCYKKLTK
ncbi:transposase [Actinopolyspora biskrensis]|uniref:Transposase n=1 Tax=Actinopolyspora biskrensis TaxID=1470178 RepID=A0A852Z058_9ACTN|nr:transposase [Actinopolyspora biskrensis]